MKKQVLIKKVNLDRVGVKGKTEYNKLIQRLMSSKCTVKDQASLGCVLGAFIGDSLGSYLEFKTGIFDESQINAGMVMSGGGHWGLAPGQVTDDSELAMSQMYALLEGEGELDMSLHCKWYGKWMRSKPFDIGRTTQNGLQNCNVNEPDPAFPLFNASKGVGKTSKSNGSLMRMSPMAVWCQNLSIADLERAVISDLSFTHSNKVAKQSCILYCLAIQKLIKNAGSQSRVGDAINIVEEYMKENNLTSEVIDFI